MKFISKCIIIYITFFICNSQLQRVQKYFNESIQSQLLNLNDEYSDENIFIL